MSKQEKIKEGIQGWVDKRFGVPNTFNTQLLYDFLVYLDENGAVIKVKCSHCCWGLFKDEEPTGMTPCWHCDSTGYKFEALIKEGE